MFLAWSDHLAFGTGKVVSDENKVFERTLWNFVDSVIIPEWEMWIQFFSNAASEYRGFVLEVIRLDGEGKSLFENTFHFVNNTIQ